MTNMTIMKANKNKALEGGGRKIRERISISSNWKEQQSSIHNDIAWIRKSTQQLSLNINASVYERI